MKPLVLCPLACSNRSGGLLLAVQSCLNLINTAAHLGRCNLLVPGILHFLPTGKSTTLRSTRRIFRDIDIIGSERVHPLDTGISGFPARKKRQISTRKPKKCIARSLQWWNKKPSRYWIWHIMLRTNLFAAKWTVGIRNVKWTSSKFLVV